MIDQDEHPDRPSPPPRERRLAVAWRSKASAVASTKLRHRWPNSERRSAFVGGPPSAGHQGFNPPPHHPPRTPQSSCLTNVRCLAPTQPGTSTWLRRIEAMRSSTSPMPRRLTPEGVRRQNDRDPLKSA